MGFPTLRDGSCKHELEELQDSHEKIIRLAAMGMTNAEIALDVGCTREKVTYTLRGELGSAKLETLQIAADIETIDIARNIHVVAEKAILLMDEVVSGDVAEATIRDRLDVAKQVLSMDGYSPVSKQIIDVNVSNAEKIGLENIRDRAQKLRLLKSPEPEIIEADFKKLDSATGDMPEGLQ